MALRISDHTLSDEVLDRAHRATYARSMRELFDITEGIDMQLPDIQEEVVRLCDSCDAQGKSARVMPGHGLLLAECRHVLGWLAFFQEHMHPDTVTVVKP